MERKKSRGSIDELAMIKAAAWAWHQHGSGLEGRPMSEYDATRTCKTPKPTRYKLEAIQEKETQEASKESRSTQEALEESRSVTTLSSPNYSDISLLDAYEIERISRQLNDYIESSHDKYYEGFLSCDHDHWRIGSSWDGDEKRSGKKKSGKRTWLRHGVVCGSRNDVVADARKVGGRRPPEKHVPLVRLDSCRSWATRLW